MSMMLIGIIILVVIFGVAGAFLFSTASGATSLLRVGTVGGVTGILGSIVGVFTDAWQLIVAALYGELGLYGWILIIGIMACLLVWGWNAYQDAAKNRPISFVD